MTLLLLSYLAGALTILAPCILPVLPFVFARAGRPFVRNGLPLLVGMAISFAAVATLATLGGAWAAEANEVGRGIAIAVLAVVGVTLAWPSLAERLTRPLVALGGRLSAKAELDASTSGRTVLPSVVLGVATGLLWAPCAGPVLGLVLTTAALQGASAHTSLLLLAYAAGAATTLGLALWVGGRFFKAMTRSLGASEWVRRGLGVAVLAGVTVVGFGWDTALLARLPSGSNAVEQSLLDRLQGQTVSQAAVSPDAQRAVDMILARTVAAAAPVMVPSLSLPVEGTLPDLPANRTWLNSPPLSSRSLRGKVVLVDFWTFACVNCQNALPHVREWAEKYKDQGLVVIGVHAPEFAFERKLENVKRAVGDLDLKFPVVIDNDFAIWKSFSNQFWPANYFIDAQGRIRFHHFGEGEYDKSEQVIRQLLEEAHNADAPARATPATAANT